MKVYMTCLALCVTDIFSELEVAETRMFIVFWDSADGFIWIVFKTGESVYFGYLSLKLWSLHMSFIQNQILFLAGKYIRFRYSSLVFHQNIINFRNLVTK